LFRENGDGHGSNVVDSQEKTGFPDRPDRKTAARLPAPPIEKIVETAGPRVCARGIGDGQTVRIFQKTRIFLMKSNGYRDDRHLTVPVFFPVILKK
jgi:hypothetical protein